MSSRKPCRKMVWHSWFPWHKRKNLQFIRQMLKEPTSALVKDVEEGRLHISILPPDRGRGYTSYSTVRRGPEGMAPAVNYSLTARINIPDKTTPDFHRLGFDRVHFKFR